MPAKLLSIAIPTWNRQDIISSSLSVILSQISDNKEDIQLIISDNASDDDTVSEVSKLLGNYQEIDAVFYKQKENTGYYGNFRKCRELASGKYFWILSDNEVLLNGGLSYILDELKKNDDVGVVFLMNMTGKSGLESLPLSFDELFISENYKLTFISACIMLNIKKQDERILNEFKGNSFLGFALLLSVRAHSNNALEISGEVYQSIPAVVSFNVFKCWTYDIFRCFEYIDKEKLFTKQAVEKMKECIIVSVLKDHMLHYRINNSYYGRDLGSFEENYSLLKSYYGYIEFFKEITDIKNTSRSLLLYRRIKKKISNRIRKMTAFQKR